LASRPLVTTVAIVSLALGIGVNTAIFSACERLLLRRLDIQEPDRIVNVTSPGPKPGSRSTGDGGRVESIFSYPLFRDLEHLDDGALFMAAHRDFGANLAYRGHTSEAEGLLVSGNYFSSLGLTPALGRLLGPDDDRVPGGHPVVVLSHSYWSTRFGADPKVVGDTLTLNGTPMTVIGVARAGFTGTTSMDRPDVFLPLMMAERAYNQPTWNGLSSRANHWLYVFARLENGLTREQAEGRINVPFAAVIRDVEFPALRRDMGDIAQRQFRERRIVLEDGARGRDSQRTETSQLLTLLLAVTGFVLAIACANVANLLLTRMADRSTEITVRLSIGASAGRLVRLLLVEAAVLGALGSLGALLVARGTLSALLAMMPPSDVAMLDFRLNTPVLLFTLALGLGSSLLFGLFPSIHAVRSAVAAGLHAQAGRTTGTRTASRVRTGLATAQIALATALLAVAGLFVASLVNLARVELGIQRAGLVTFRVSPYLNGYSVEQSRALFARLENELRGVPGVTSVTSSTVPILANSNWGNNVTVEGFHADPEADTKANVAQTSTEYFRTLGIPILAGREFTETDAAAAPRVAVVNQAFAEKFNLGEQAIGKRMAMGAGDNEPLDIEIVGMVADARYSEVRTPAPPQFYLPYRQAEGVGTLTFYVRTRSSVQALMGAIAPIVSRLDGNLPLVDLRTMDDQIWENTAPQRVLTGLSSSFATLATLLAAIGLYAVLAYLVAQRLREIGIRMALGARGIDISRLVLSHVGRITVVGGAIGIALALALGRLAQALMVGVGDSAAAIILSAALIVSAVALAAGAAPAWRAATVNPVEALRAE